MLQYFLLVLETSSFLSGDPKELLGSTVLSLPRNSRDKQELQ